MYNIKKPNRLFEVKEREVDGDDKEVRDIKWGWVGCVTYAFRVYIGRWGV